MAPSQRDFYEILGVKKTATHDEIRKAYEGIAAIVEAARA